jgi:hypothetical protein
VKAFVKRAARAFGVAYCPKRIKCGIIYEVAISRQLGIKCLERKGMGMTHWIPTFPGIAISLTIVGYNLLGDGLRDALDPRMRR